MENDNHSEKQAAAQLESIIEMVKKLNQAQEKENDDEIERAQRSIQEDALSVQVRSGWYQPGENPVKPEEFTILLCTGGPACRIIGELDECLQPETARIEHQDWFTPWKEYDINADQEEKVLEYCQQFYFGD
jgi:hypothetical protein